MTTNNYGHWDTSLVGDFDPLDYYGFVYLVTNVTSGKMYIGKKSMWSTVTKKVWKVDGSGKKNSKVTVESKWRSYTTSSRHINGELLAGQQFKFQILTLHTSKGTLAYSEVDHMVKRDVLRARFANGDRAYYNGCIPGIKFLPGPEAYKKVSEKLKGRIISEEQRKKQSDALKGKPNLAAKGIPKSKEHKERLSAALRGEKNPKFGTKTSEETKSKISVSLTGDKNPMYGKPHSSEHNRKISETMSSKFWITNGIESTRISGEIPEGWRRGRK